LHRKLFQDTFKTHIIKDETKVIKKMIFCSVSSCLCICPCVANDRIRWTGSYQTSI